jgi:crotonobetaine/carnitine-CoA ligase
MLGYYKDEIRTSEAMRGGWLHTGDLGYQDEEGYFYFLGRKKEVLRRRGELISPAEIEGVINSHPAVSESAVIGIDSELGLGEQEIKAYVRLKQAGTVNFETLISWCLERLSEFKVPRYWEFIEDFPKSAIGRIQKNVLKQEKEDLTANTYDRLREDLMAKLRHGKRD